jgi:Flp pilus assembly protein TadD
VHVSLGSAYSAVGDWLPALHHYRQVLRRQPDDARALYNVGAALHNVGQIEEARRWIARAADLGFQGAVSSDSPPPSDRR